MRRRFGTYVVAALPRELADGRGWLADFSLEEHRGSHVDDRMYWAGLRRVLAVSVQKRERQMPRAQTARGLRFRPLTFPSVLPLKVNRNAREQVPQKEARPHCRRRSRVEPCCGQPKPRPTTPLPPRSS